MLVPVLIGAGLIGLFLLSKKQDGVSSAPAQLPPPQFPSPQPPSPQQTCPTVAPAQQQPFQAAPPPRAVPVNFPQPAAAAPPPVAQAVPAGQKARVTTNDSPPMGDLIMRTAPSDSAAQVAGGGAEKDGIVSILELQASPDGVWSKIVWPGGSRRPGATGFAKRRFLTLLV